MEKEWLAQYYGCPFTVWLDIFPDYLPWKETDQILQRKQVKMALRTYLSKIFEEGVE